MPTQAHDARPRRARARAGAACRRRGAATPPSLACERCRTPARCAVCTGPLGSRRARPAAGLPLVRHRRSTRWACPECGHRGLRAPVLGERRTAEELGRAFPDARCVASGGDQVVGDGAATEPAIVVATPGAEPVAAGGLRRRRAARHLAGARRGPTCAPTRRRCAAGSAPPRWSPARGGGVVAVGDPAQPALQALVRWDPAGFARREASERRPGAPAAGVPAGDAHRRARTPSTTP